MSVGAARGKVLLQACAAPAADAGDLVGGDVERPPALQIGAAELAAAFQAEREVARCVALGAVAERGGQIGAPRLLGRQRRIGLEAMVAEEDGVPEGHAPALAERESEARRPGRSADRLQAEEVGFDGQRVGARHGRERGERHRGIEAPTVLADPLPHRPHELIVGVAANARRPVRRDVGRIHGSERQLEGATAGEGPAAGHGVAGDAVGGRGQILAPRHHAIRGVNERSRPGRRRPRARRGQHEAWQHQPPPAPRPGLHSASSGSRVAPTARAATEPTAAMASSGAALAMV